MDNDTLNNDDLVNDTLVRKESGEENKGKKGVINLLVFVSLVILTVFVCYLYNKSKGNIPAEEVLLQPSSATPLSSDVAGGNLGESENGKEVKNMNEPEKDLKIEDVVVGTGMEAVSGKKVTVNYLGTLVDGTKFDSSYDRGTPFSFNLGEGEVIKGWDMGVLGMKVGGKRKLTIPSSLAYGDQGIAGAIPGGATLVFEVELLKVE